MPPKGSKAMHKKNNFLAVNNDLKTKISKAEQTLKEKTFELEKLKESHKFLLHEKDLEIKKFSERKKRKETKIEELKRELKKVDDIPVVVVSKAKVKHRLKNPTSSTIGVKAKQRRCKETLAACKAIHGGNLNSTVDGMMQTLTSKCKSEWLADRILLSKKSLRESLNKQIIGTSKKKYYDSRENILRSLNVYYSQDVLGKRKYIAIRKANKCPGICNFAPYNKLSKCIRDIDIGEVKDIEVFNDSEVWKVDGKFRPLLPFAKVLAQFYLTVNESRIDKLFFRKQNEIENNLFTFLVAVGGDEAPESGTAFLISFFNVGERIACSKENYLLFAFNVKETVCLSKSMLIIS